MTQNGNIREYLKDRGNASAREIFDDCRVNSPRKRISELRRSGVGIGSFWDHSTDEYGVTHRYKRYYLE